MRMFELGMWWQHSATARFGAVGVTTQSAPAQNACSTPRGTRPVVVEQCLFSVVLSWGLSPGSDPVTY